jgi:hypothetical protein
MTEKIVILDEDDCEAYGAYDASTPLAIRGGEEMSEQTSRRAAFAELYGPTQKPGEFEDREEYEAYIDRRHLRLGLFIAGWDAAIQWASEPAASDTQNAGQSGEEKK